MATINLLYIGLSLVFAVAAIGRILHPELDAEEQRTLFPYLPRLPGVVIMSEILFAILFLTRFQKPALAVAFIGLIFYNVHALIFAGKQIKETFKDVCVYKPNATAFLLHITYLTVVAHLLFL